MNTIDVMSGCGGLCGKTGKDGVIDLVPRLHHSRPEPELNTALKIWHNFKIPKTPEKQSTSSLHKCEFIYKSSPTKYTLNKQDGKYTQAVMHTKCIATSNSSCRYRKENYLFFFFQTHINNVAFFCLLLCNTSTIQLPAILHNSGSECVLPVRPPISINKFTFGQFACWWTCAKALACNYTQK